MKKLSFLLFTLFLFGCGRNIDPSIPVSNTLIFAAFIFCISVYILPHIPPLLKNIFKIETSTHIKLVWVFIFLAIAAIVITVLIIDIPRGGIVTIVICLIFMQPAIKDYLNAIKGKDENNEKIAFGKIRSILTFIILVFCIFGFILSRIKF